MSALALDVNRTFSNWLLARLAPTAPLPVRAAILAVAFGVFLLPEIVRLWGQSIAVKAEKRPSEKESEGRLHARPMAKVHAKRARIVAGSLREVKWLAVWATLWFICPYLSPAFAWAARTIFATGHWLADTRQAGRVGDAWRALRYWSAHAEEPSAATSAMPTQQMPRECFQGVERVFVQALNFLGPGLLLWVGTVPQRVSMYISLAGALVGATGIWCVRSAISRWSHANFPQKLPSHTRPSEQVGAAQPQKTSSHDQVVKPRPDPLGLATLAEREAQMRVMHAPELTEEVPATAHEQDENVPRPPQDDVEDVAHATNEAEEDLPAGINITTRFTQDELDQMVHFARCFGLPPGVLPIPDLDQRPAAPGQEPPNDIGAQEDANQYPGPGSARPAPAPVAGQPHYVLEPLRAPTPSRPRPQGHPRPASDARQNLPGANRQLIMPVTQDELRGLQHFARCFDLPPNRLPIIQ